MDTDSFILYIKTSDTYKNIAEDFATRFDTSNSELYRLLPKGKNTKVIGLMKYDVGGKIMTKFVGLRAKTSQLIYQCCEVKKAKSAKSVS